MSAGASGMTDKPPPEEGAGPFATLRSSRPRWPEWASRALFESALIVFSVFLGLALNEWADQRRQAAHARVALTAIVAEVQANRGSLVGASEFHRQIRLCSNTFKRPAQCR